MSENNQTENNQTDQNQTQEPENTSTVIADAISEDSTNQEKNSADTNTEDSSSNNVIADSIKDDETKDTEEVKDTAEAKEFEPYDLVFAEDSPLTDDQIDKIAKLAEDNKWTQDKAEEYISQVEDYYKQGLESANAPMTEYLGQQNDLFKGDSDFQGDNLEASRLHMKRAIDKFGDDALREQIQKTYIGGNHALAKFLIKVGKQLDESAPLEGSGNSSETVDSHTEMLKNMYPNQFV